jgi:hypothetical protein
MKGLSSMRQPSAILSACGVSLESPVLADFLEFTCLDYKLRLAIKGFQRGF